MFLSSLISTDIDSRVVTGNDLYGNVLIGKHEFAAVIGIGWTSCAVDMKTSKRVQSVASLWENGDTEGELKKKYREESTNKMFALASKLPKVDSKRELWGASGVLPQGVRKKVRVVETKGKQKRKRADDAKGRVTGHRSHRRGENWERLGKAGALMRKGKQKPNAVPSESSEVGSPAEVFNSDILDNDNAGETSEGIGSDWAFAEDDEEDDKEDSSE